MTEPTPVPDAAEVLASLLPTLDEFTMPCEVCKSAGCPDCDDIGWWKAGDVIRNYMALPDASLTPAPGEGLTEEDRGQIAACELALKQGWYKRPPIESDVRELLAIIDRLTTPPAPLPDDEEPPPFGSVPFGTMFIPGGGFIHGDNEWHEFPGPLTLPPRPLPDDEER